VPLLLLVIPLVSALTRGQATVIMVALIIAAVSLQRRGREWLAGILLTVAILMKVFPAAVLFYYGLRGRWRFVAITVLLTAVGATILPAPVFGWKRSLGYFSEWSSLLTQSGIEAAQAKNPRFEELANPRLVRNQSLPAVVLRLTGDRKGRLVGFGIALLMALAIALVAWRTGERADPFLVCATLAWTLLASPVAFSHYFLLLLLPLAALVRGAAAEEDPRLRRLAFGAVLLFGILSYSSSSSKPLKTAGMLCWATAILWAACLRLAILKDRLGPAARAAPASGERGLVP